jgi:hypothetical protein
MKNYQGFRAGILILGYLLISGCTTVAPVSTGEIEGSVLLHEMNCADIPSAAGVSVQIVGTSIKATTDSIGNFTLDNVPAGYYSIDYTKPGFGEYIESPIEFVGAGTYPAMLGAELARVKNWKITLGVPTIYIQLNPGVDTNFLIGFTNDTPIVTDSLGVGQSSQNSGGLTYFAARTPNIDYNDPSTYTAYGSSRDHGLTLDNQAFGNNVHGGDTIYVVAYANPCTLSQYSYYVGDTMKFAFSGFSPPSNTVKVVLP